MRISLVLPPKSSPGSSPPTRQNRRSAVAAAEFALLAPFLAALVIGMCELGRSVMVKDILTDAARKGCRTGVMPNKTYQDILNDVTNVLTDNNITASSATITVQVASYNGTSTSPSWGSPTTVTSNSSYNPNPLDEVSVKVSVPLANVLWFTPVFLPQGGIESETFTMLRQE